MVAYQREHVTAIRTELQPLIEAHHTATAPPGSPLSINWDLYRALDDAGTLQCVTARVDGKLVGYLTHYAHSHPHYGETWAVADAFYVLPEHRAGGVGVRLVEVADQFLAAEGVAVIAQAVPAGGRDFGPMLERLGYEVAETVYRRRLMH